VRLPWLAHDDAPGPYITIPRYRFDKTKKHTAGDGSNQKGVRMGAGYVNLRKQRKRQQRKVGRKEEGSSSNRPELAAFVLALRSTPVTKPMLYLCDNQSCKKLGRRRRESDVSGSARRRHFTRSTRRAPKKNNSRSSEVSGQVESASRRFCK